ncbi:hypothetical protein RCL06_24655, partial [Salmonella enterica subsp. enterica serovar Typhimurium]
KSSLVRAGVVAARRRAGRRVSVVTPGANLTDELSASCQDDCEVVVVDQCEELATTHAEDARSNALDTLVGVIEERELVVVVRAD